MIYAVHFGASLSEQLAGKLLDDYHDRPFELARVRIILPTRRACKTLKEAFLKYQKDCLLPQIIPLYDLGKLNPDIPPAISKWERLFLLTKLCRAKPNLHDAAKAFQVAVSLSELLDLAYQYKIDLKNLDTLVAGENFAQHWQETMTFLAIIQTEWPKILESRHCLDEQDRLQKLLNAETENISHQDSPIIAAGLTADLPAVANLLTTIYHHPKGEIFLDGIDMEYLNSNSTPNASHPQFLIHKTLKQLNCSPNQLKFIGQPTPQEPWVMDAFRADHWNDHHFDSNITQPVTYLECANIEQEALTIALKFREILETPNQTAQLVTTDRNLSRRVINQMKRWKVFLDDSAGLPFAHTSTGSFLLQILQMAQHPDNPAAVLGVYKHPLFADGQDRGKVRKRVKQAEKLARQQNTHLEWALNYQGQEFFNLFRPNQMVSLNELLSQHLKLAEQWASDGTPNSQDYLWNSDTGRELKQVFDEVQKYTPIIDCIETDSYANLFQLILSQSEAHKQTQLHPQIKILGPIEARLSHADICIIGGLNEQVFPPDVDTGPWLNRNMLSVLGLPPPEAKIAALAHDFMHLACSPRVILTRSVKSGGTPTVPSRFLSRLWTVLQVNHLPVPVQNANLANLVDTPDISNPIVRPTPCPPAHLRPKKLSVTNIELLKRNPYAIYAKYILSLYPLNDLGLPPKASLYGQVIHDTLAEFMNRPTDIQNLKNLFSQKIQKTTLSTADRLFYNSTFEHHIAPFIIENYQKCQTYTEITGQATIPIHNHNFTVTARVDRVDIQNNQATIIDYKTGTTPTFNQVVKGYCPQLSLEAWLILQGGFNDIHPTDICDLSYWHLGRNCKISNFSDSKHDVTLDQLIQQTENGLKQLLELFDCDTTPYEVCPISKLAPTYNDYQHLARQDEWGHLDEGEENDSGE